ncbi:MAG: cobalt ECF transporter T component CbiQ [Armatimonadota bacterium]
MRELYARRTSPIHRLDARVKVLFTLAFVLSLSLTPFRAWPAYILYLTLSLSIASVSRLGIGFVLARAFLALPFILAALPLVFFGPPGYVALPIGSEWQLTYSPEGLGRFVSITIRSWISIQIAIIMAATTRFPDLLTALQQIKVPPLFGAIVGLMWRYLFVISDEVTRMTRARASRSATSPDARNAGGTLFWRAKVTGGMAGSLFLRSLERADRVHAAMLSRGYTGKLPVSETTPLSGEARRILYLGFGLLALLWLLGLLTGS